MSNTKRKPLDPYEVPGSFFGKTWEGYLIAPVGRNRDSDLLTESNWEMQLKELRAIPQNPDEETAEWEIVRENHWACGWIEWVAIRADAVTFVEAMEALAYRLDQYPVLNEDDWSAREYEAACESFDRYSVKDLAEQIGTGFDLKPRTVARLKEIDPSKVLEFALDRIGTVEIIAEGGGASFVFNDPGSEYAPVNRHDLAVFLFTNRRIS